MKHCFIIVAEVCSGGELPEVEIISLLEEQIPRYRLRADALTQFQGELFILLIIIIFRIFNIFILMPNIYLEYINKFLPFSGYENADWFVPAPALRLEDVDLKLSPEQIRETLNYFSEYFSIYYKQISSIFDLFRKNYGFFFFCLFQIRDVVQMISHKTELDRNFEAKLTRRTYCPFFEIEKNIF